MYQSHQQYREPLALQIGIISDSVERTTSDCGGSLYYMLKTEYRRFRRSHIIINVPSMNSIGSSHIEWHYQYFSAADIGSSVHVPCLNSPLLPWLRAREYRCYELTVTSMTGVWRPIHTGELRHPAHWLCRLLDLSSVRCSVVWYAPYESRDEKWNGALEDERTWLLCCARHSQRLYDKNVYLRWLSGDLRVVVGLCFGRTMWHISNFFWKRYMQ